MTVHQLHHDRIDTEREVTGVFTLGLDLTSDTAVTDGRQLPCRQNDADLWFAETPTELEYAKSLCGDCPVRVECLAGALERQEPWGVWGGEIFERGAIVARKRPRGRPRKDDAVTAAKAQAALASRTADLLVEKAAA
ncbi:WhiB family redox-sensing transcriptional regulator [Phytomonospora endophytica]|uniref:Transcriptional regulator WhiB n=1 Tax=Phytomonospora endophytica TaxID=714109 RepID=A0A841FHQ3_9ACTN|nr:WhiB family redox-sensing transcriptional regulator [Phytomonospora endophytica]GIG65329.1 transcriptional regulator WhiB [Phytomonospora endophytica]